MNSLIHLFIFLVTGAPHHGPDIILASGTEFQHILNWIDMMGARHDSSMKRHQPNPRAAHVGFLRKSTKES